MSKTNFDLTKIRGLAFDVDGVLSPSAIPLDPDGVPRRMTNLKDGFAFREAVTKGLKIAIITGGVSDGVVERFDFLGVKDVFLGSRCKIEVFRKWMSDNGLTPDCTAYAGDDVPDCECMRLAALAIAPADAAVDAKAVANYISPQKGGDGVARDIIEQVLRAQGKWPTSAVANG